MDKANDNGSYLVFDICTHPQTIDVLCSDLSVKTSALPGKKKIQKIRNINLKICLKRKKFQKVVFFFY